MLANNEDEGIIADNSTRATRTLGRRVDPIEGSWNSLEP